MQTQGATRVVYVVDADTSVREGLSRLIESAGLEARPCASVEELLSQSGSDVSACVLLDVTGLGDRNAAAQSSLHSLAERLPVIALSSSDGPGARRAARELGARHFFRKPVDAAALLDSIDWVVHAGDQGSAHR